jgi:hypothetical protein
MAMCRGRRSGSSCGAKRDSEVSVFTAAWEREFKLESLKT